MKWYFLSSTIFWNRAKFILGSIHLLSTSRKISLWLYSGCWLACSRNPILEQFQHNSSFTCGFSYIITYGPHPVFLNYFFILWIVFLDWLTWNNRSTATSDWQHSVANFFQTFFLSYKVAYPKKGSRFACRRFSYFIYFAIFWLIRSVLLMSRGSNCLLCFNLQTL